MIAVTSLKPILIRDPKTLATISQFKRFAGIETNSAAAAELIRRAAALGLHRREVVAQIIDTAIKAATHN